MKILYKSNLALLICILELSLLPIMLMFGGSTTGSIKLLFYSFLIGSIVSLTIAYAFDREGLKALLKSPKTFTMIGIAGLLNNAISQLLLAIGTIATNPSIAAIVFRAWVIIAAVLTPIVLRNKVTKAQLGAIFLGFFGLYVIASQGVTLSINEAFSQGMLYLFGAAAVYAFAPTILKLYNASTTASIAVFNVVSLIFISGLALLTNTSLFNGLNTQFIGTALFLGIATYGIGTTLYFYAYKNLSHIFVGNATLAIPFITILISLLFLGTSFHMYYLYTALLISIAVFAQLHFSPGAPEYLRKEKSDKLQFFDVTSAFVENRELSDYISNENRALAAKIDTNDFLIKPHEEMLDRYGCLLFTNRAPYQNTKDEIEFVNHIMGAEENDTILIGMGDVKNIENAFKDLLLKDDLDLKIDPGIDYPA